VVAPRRDGNGDDGEDGVDSARILLLLLLRAAVAVGGGSLSLVGSFIVELLR
jgi:hypothetical protein